MDCTSKPQSSAKLFITSAPSGAGKSSLNATLLKRDSTLKMSVSFTTRAPRKGEVDGKDYNFVTLEEFNRRKDAGEFLETALVHGNYYGTSRLWIEEELRKGVSVILEIDWQGAKQVKKIFPDAVTIFILPPSMEILEKRLRGRGTDSEEVIEKRLAGAALEISQAPHFEYVIVNDDFETAADDLYAIARSARLTFATQKIAKKETFTAFGL